MDEAAAAVTTSTEMKTMDSEARRIFRKRFLKWLRGEFPREDADLFYYHLGDLRDALKEGADLIESLPDLDSARHAEQLRTAVATLTGQLLDHIPAHTKEIEAGLNNWRDQLYAAAEDADEL